MRTGLCLALALAGAATSVSADDAAGKAASYVEFEHDFHSQCVMRNGKMRLVRSTHPGRRIKIYLQRYYAGVRQPGRTTEVLEPGREAVTLGCTVVDGRPQDWKLVKARFVE